MQAEPAQPPEPGEEADLGRRSFFRVFGRNAVRTAGQVAGAADALRRGASAAASEILDLGVSGSEAAAGRLATAAGTPSGARVQRLKPGEVRTVPAEPAAQGSTYRSPYRLEDEAVMILDQRGLPDRFDEMECRDGREVARAIRAGAAHGGPLVGQIAAYGLALSAHIRRDAKPSDVKIELDLVTIILKRCDSPARPIVTAMERLAARRAALPVGGPVPALADALRDEADAIASEAALDHATLARHGLGLMPPATDRPLELLIHGPLGSMGNGLVATGLGIVKLLIAEERPVHVWVTEGRPTLGGARVLAWELQQADVPHTVLSDNAVSWLFDRGGLDAVLLGAEWVTANGDTVASIGSASIAALASVTAQPPVPVYLCAPTSSIGLASDAATVMQMIPAKPTSPPSRAAPVEGRPVTAPTVEVIRARHLSAIVTEAGVLRPPFGPALQAAASKAS